MISYIFNCNCEYPVGAVPANSTGKFLCPNHGESMKAKKVDCPECGAVETFPHGGRTTDLCSECKKAARKVYEKARTKRRHKLSMERKKERPKGVLRTFAPSSVAFRDTECRTYDWCLTLDLRKLMKMDCAGCERKRGGARHGSYTATNSASGMVAYGHAGRHWQHGL